MKKDGDQLFLKVGGYIGENSEFFDISLAGIRKLRIDLAEVNYLNSVGIKNWIFWTRKLSGVEVTFSGCPPLVINQMNAVVDFFPQGAIVDSFYLQYFCDNCSNEKNILLERGKEFDFASSDKPSRVDIPDTIECPKCKGEMEIDVVRDKYFFFLNHNTKS